MKLDEIKAIINECFPELRYSYSTEVWWYKSSLALLRWEGEHPNVGHVMSVDKLYLSEDYYINSKEVHWDDCLRIQSYKGLELQCGKLRKKIFELEKIKKIHNIKKCGDYEV